MLKILLVLFFSLGTACTLVGPNYQEPKTSITPHWLHKQATPIRETSPHTAAWWKVFQDPTLTHFIHQGYQNNLSLQIAGVHVLQARAQLAQSIGELYPQQQAMVGNYTYERIGGSSLQTILPPSFDTASLGFSINWELDFWGKYRRAIQSNDAAFLASLSAYDQSLVTLTADIAQAYIALRTTQTLIKVTHENIQLQKESLAIASARFRAGQISLLDVEQAKTELSQTEATLPTLVTDLQRQKDTLAVLLGTTPDRIERQVALSQNRGIPKAPRTIAVGIPKETLSQRPDIHQARLEAMAQSAAIGATQANLYPAFSLLGTFVFSSNSIGNSSINDLFQWSNRSISAGPGLNWPLFNYGQITNAVRAQDAAFQQALLKYVNAVLKAQQEVQDSITQYIEAQKTHRFLVQANLSAIASTHLALIRYKEGETDYTTVLDAQRQQLQVQTSLTNATGNISQAVVSLYRALGGGWEIRKGHAILPRSIRKEMEQRTHWGTLLKEKTPPLPPKNTIAPPRPSYQPTW